MQNNNANSRSNKPKVLIYLLGSLGDTLITIPALRAVRRHFSDAKLVVLQNIPPHGNIVKASQVVPPDLVDDYLEYAGLSGRLGKIYDFVRLWRKLRRHQFQSIVYLVPVERAESSVSRDRIFFRLSGISQFFGFHTFSKSELYPVDETGALAMTKSEGELKAVRLGFDGIISSSEDFRRPLLLLSTGEIENIKNWLATRRTKKAARLISIAPGCKTIANSWSEENFIEIGRRLLAEGDFEIIVVGGKAERETAQKLISSWGEGINAAGEFSVRESAAVLSLCDFHIGLDTGTTHLAASVGTRCFALFHGRNNPGQWFPIGNGHMIILHKVECAGCRLSVCPVPLHPCMSGISVEAVWKNLREFMLTQEAATALPTQIIAV